MTSGAPLYLVSACGSAEEFVAAFRRYADRTGLFIPCASPLPAGRRGRLAVTLKEGGVMIEGEAEILQSSNKPTVLYGRPGMTVKFVEPDEPSKVILSELEKARLAMKVPAPSVPPRPAKDFPAEPRPVPPPPGGRIDATNALAECIVIGDLSSLKETEQGSGKAKFVVPSIPGAPGGRPKSPSVPPEPASSTKATLPPVNVNPKMTSIGFPAIDKLPANAANPPKTSAENPLLNTIQGTQAPPNPTKEIKAENPLLQTQHGVSAPKSDPSAAPPAPAPKTDSGPAISRSSTLVGPPIVADGAPAAPAANVGSGAVAAPAAKVGSGAVAAPAAKVGSGAVAAPAAKVGSGAVAAPSANPMARVVTDEESTSIGEMPPKKIADPMPTAAPAKSPVAPDSPRGKQQHKATSIGFPALRTPFETQAVGVVPPPTNRDPGTPNDPLVAKSKPSLPNPRAKNPTAPPMTPRNPTPAVPLPIVRLPMKPQPLIAQDGDEDEKTDLSNIPQPTATKPSGSTELPPESPMAQIDPDPQIAALSGRSGGMRASEIMAAIPTEDWTMTPDASGPTVLPTSGDDNDASGVEVTNEPTPAPGGMPKGPPTGNWTIALDPETGWQEPQKLAPTPVAPPPPAPKEKPKSGNPDIAIASDKAFTAVEWEEKPTGIGEAKIEIDPTLMEPLKPMPALDDDDAPGSSRPAPAMAARSDVPPPLAPMPVGPQSRGIPAAAILQPGMAHGHGGMQSGPGMPPAGDFSGFSSHAGAFPQPPAGMHGLGASGSVVAMPDSAPSKKRNLVIGVAAAVAVIAGFVLVLMLSGGKKKTTKAHGGGGSAMVHATPVDAAAVIPMHEGSATGSGDDTDDGSGGSAQVAIVEPAGSGAGATQNPNPPTNNGPCHVDVASAPAGADVYLGKDKLGTAPGTFDLPCGAATTLTLKKAHYLATDRAITPSAEKPNKVVIKLGKTMFSLKVTSTPAGATITAGGKSAGVTPATIKLAGFEASTITLSKPGYTTDTEKVVPKSNGQAHHVVLKKKTGH